MKQFTLMDEHYRKRGYRVNVNDKIVILHKWDTLNEESWRSSAANALEDIKKNLRNDPSNKGSRQPIPYDKFCEKDKKIKKKIIQDHIDLSERSYNYNTQSIRDLIRKKE